MTSKPQETSYPDHLNPFGSVEELDGISPNSENLTTNKLDEYPDYLSPFDEDDKNTSDLRDPLDIDEDYDESLNPFGDEESVEDANQAQQVTPTVEITQAINDDDTRGTPFDEDYDNYPKQILESHQINDDSVNAQGIQKSVITTSSQPESLDCPPVPLPRTKSLLKKELARKSKLQNENSDNQSTSSSSTNIQSTNVVDENNRNSLSSLQEALTSFQKKKNKRNAPPVPINFKRQVSGSLSEIEEELNIMGDQLQSTEEQFLTCQDNLKESFNSDKDKFLESRTLMIDILDRKNSILRRQKELMYRKRELKLDQIHSDIEYELRMIGNKQVSTRTPEDHAREKELLTKLVEIVEEKSDIVENLNKESNCDTHTLKDIFARLEITDIETSGSKSKEEPASSDIDIAKSKKQNCDKGTVAMGIKMSKIATLIPNKGTIKGTIKNAKRKRLFLKNKTNKEDITAPK